MGRKDGTKKRNGVVITSNTSRRTPKQMAADLGMKPFRAQFVGSFSNSNMQPCQLCVGSGARFFLFGKPMGSCSNCHGTGTKGGR